MDLDEALAIIGDVGAKALCESRHRIPVADPCALCRLDSAVVLSAVLADAVVGVTMAGNPILTLPVGWKWDPTRLQEVPQ